MQLPFARPVRSHLALFLRCHALREHALPGQPLRGRPYTTPPPNAPITVEHFRQIAFLPERPLLLPNAFTAHTLPALAKWFAPSLSATAGPDAAPARLNHAYLAPHATHPVPLELTTHNDPAAPDASFTRLDRPLADFLAYVALREHHPHAPAPAATLYLAQHPLSALPAVLQADVPTPLLVRAAGRGDVYASSLWLGVAPTATPLHRDPNPNLLVQLCGRKRVRMLAPALGAEVFREVRRAAGRGVQGESMRGEEMMVGEERRGLDAWLWGKEESAFEGVRGRLGAEAAWEGEIDAGGAVFIPKGWWHGVRGEGSGVSASVNWWFR